MDGFSKKIRGWRKNNKYFGKEEDIEMIFLTSNIII